MYKKEEKKIVQSFDTSRFSFSSNTRTSTLDSRTLDIPIDYVQNVFRNNNIGHLDHI